MANNGNGAREKLIEYFLDRQFGDETVYDNRAAAVDHLLTWLYSMGYKVVPVDTPARRGKGKKVTATTASPWIGKSHTAKLIQ